MKLAKILKHLRRQGKAETVDNADYDLPAGKYRSVQFIPKKNTIIVLGESTYADIGSRSEVDVMATLSRVEVVMDTTGRWLRVVIFDNSHEPLEDMYEPKDFEDVVEAVYKKVRA